MTPGAWLTCCLISLLTAVVADQANVAARDSSVSANDIILEGLLGRSGYPRMNVRGTSRRWNPFFRDFNASAAQTDNEVGPPYVLNSVGQRSDSGNSSLAVVRRRSTRISFRTAQTTSDSRLIGSNDMKVKPPGALEFWDKTRRARKAEDAVHNAEKSLDKMSSNSSHDNMPTPSKNSSAQAFVAQPMSEPCKERQPAALLTNLIRGAFDGLPYLSFSNRSFRHTCKYDLHSATSDSKQYFLESTHESEYVIPVSFIVLTFALLFIIAAIVINLLASICTSSTRQARQAGAEMHPPQPGFEPPGLPDTGLQERAASPSRTLCYRLATPELCEAMLLSMYQDDQRWAVQLAEDAAKTQGLATA
ncbi:hypothetical protein HPB51_028638 [Rhipicephalus microplus]|uniref:Uncharacterized protein n=1 Tax=Rhipicephalus microplus TaxID=6941 RepID=A0A9J6CWH8_RHIMP|nr:hypothetical protein HPB51_028638 [Rhipicephalus microplus]